MPTGLTTAERRLWLRWVLATTLGSLLGWAVSGAVVSGGETRFDDVTSPLLGALVLGVTAMIAFGVQGAAIGLAQGIVLRHFLARSGWWVVATGGGWTVGGAVSGGLAGSVGGAMTGVGLDAGVAGIVVTFMAGGAALLFLAFPLAMAGAAPAGEAGRMVGAGVSRDVLRGERPRVSDNGGDRSGAGLGVALCSGLGSEWDAGGPPWWSCHRGRAGGEARDSPCQQPPRKRKGSARQGDAEGVQGTQAPGSRVGASSG